jgi:hypothetical protein
MYTFSFVNEYSKLVGYCSVVHRRHYNTIYRCHFLLSIPLNGNEIKPKQNDFSS